MLIVFQAMSLKKREMAKLLINSGASTNLKDAFGYTARSIAQQVDLNDLLPSLPQS